MSKDEVEEDITAIGKRIGSRLAAQKGSIAQPAVAARLFAEAVIAQHPTVKLPELVRDDEVKCWLEARSVGQGQLRQALAEARRATRSAPVDSPVRRPRRKARTGGAASLGMMTTGAIPNRPLTEL